MNVRRVALFTTACALFAADGSKRGMRPEDFLAIEAIADPHLSPDGKQVAYALGTVDRKRTKRVSSIWLAAADGKTPPRQLTFENSSHPRWSPDGRALAILSSRAAAGSDSATPPRTQVYLLPMSGGEAVRLTNFPENVTDFEWSPDGTRLACVTKSAPAGGTKPSDIRHYTSAIYKYDASGWYDHKRSHIWLFDVADKRALQVTGDPASDDTEPAWSPDGASLAYVSQKVDNYPGTGGSVYVIPAAGGAAVRISDQDGLAHGPRWAEDGRQIAYIASPNDADDARIWLSSPKGGGSKLASRQLDVIPLDIDWSADGKQVIFLAAAKGEQQLFRLNVASGAIAAVTRAPAVILSEELNFKHGRMVYVLSDPTHLGDLYISDLEGNHSRQLTHINQKIYGEIGFQPAERMTFPGADGMPVEEFLIKPMGWEPGRKYPMILCIHGGPGGMWAMRFYHEFQMLAARGWAVLYANPRGSSGYGEKFQRAVAQQWGGKTYTDLMRGVDYALEKYPWIDRDRLGVTGGSFGGFMTNWIVGHTTRFKAAVTLASIANFTSLEGTRDMAYSHAKDFGGDLFENFNFYWEQSPLKYARNVKTPTLVVHGDADHRVPIEQGEQWFRALRHFGVPAEFLIFPRENHSIAVDPNHRVDLYKWQTYWFERYMNGNAEYPAPDTE